MKAKTRVAIAAAGVAGLFTLGAALMPAEAATTNATTAATGKILNLCITIHPNAPICLGI
jgi:hypothetical protein